MRIIVISLLFSITVGNALHAMEDDEKIDINLGKTYDVVPGIQLANVVVTLRDMKLLAEKMFNSQQTRSKRKIKIPEPSKIEIPDDIKIDPEVFNLYANQENLITQPQLGWLKRMLCCKPKENNPFKHAHSDFREEWAKTMLFLCYEPNNQVETTTTNMLIDVSDATFEEQHGIQRMGKALTSGGDEDNNVIGIFKRESGDDDANSSEQQESDDSSAKQIRALEQELKETLWRLRKLEKKIQLDKGLQEFFEKQQKSDDNSDRRKERFLEFLLVAATGFGAYYGGDAG